MVTRLQRWSKIWAVRTWFALLLHFALKKLIAWNVTPLPHYLQDNLLIFLIFAAEVRRCPVCEMLVDSTVKILENPNSDHAMDHVLEKACRAVPYQYQDICFAEIERYGSTIFSNVLTSSDHSSVCRELGICQGGSLPKPKLLGAKKCTYGPGYWCINEDTAKECNVCKQVSTPI